MPYKDLTHPFKPFFMMKSSLLVDNVDKEKPLKSSLPKRPTFSTVFHGHLLVALANVLTKGSPEKLKPSFLERAAF